jgi:hypothetical protein
VDLDQLRPVIEARVREMRAAFEGSPDDCRAAFRALLGGRRMRVFPDQEHRFRVEGMLELALETTVARADQGDSGRRHFVVAGGCNARVPWRSRRGEHGCRSLPNDAVSGRAGDSQARQRAGDRTQAGTARTTRVAIQPYK